jgi:hypothetical protein
MTNAVSSVDSVVAHAKVVHTSGGAGESFYAYIPGVGSVVACNVGGFGVSAYADLAGIQRCSTAFAAWGVVS